MSSVGNTPSKLVQLKSRRGDIIAKLNSLNDNLFLEETTERDKRIIHRDIDLIKKDLHEIDLKIKIEKKAAMALNLDPQQTSFTIPRTPPPTQDPYIEDIFEDEFCKTGAQVPPTEAASSTIETPLSLTFSSNIGSGAIPKTPIRTASSNIKAPIPSTISSNVDMGANPKTPIITTSIINPIISSGVNEHLFRKESNEEKITRLEIENKRMRNYYENILKDKQNFELKKGVTLKTTQNKTTPNSTQNKYEPYKSYNQHTSINEPFSHIALNEQDTQQIPTQFNTPLKEQPIESQRAQMEPPRNKPKPFSLSNRHIHLNEPYTHIASNEQQFEKQVFTPYKQSQAQQLNAQPQTNPNADHLTQATPRFEQWSPNVPRENQLNTNEIKPRDTFLRRLRAIPIFNGESYTDLRDFIDIADTLYCSCTNQVEENEFFDQLMLQIRGEARIAVYDNDDPTWEGIKAKLLSYFSFLSNKEIITSKLENLRQAAKETISDYAERTRKLLTEKNRTYTNLSEEQKLEHNRLARRTFAKGITNTKLRERLMIRGANTLEDAIAYAIESENDSVNEIANGELYCQYCRAPGHRQRDCRRKNTDDGGVNQLIAALRNLGNANANRRISNSTPNQRRNPNQFNSWTSNNRGWFDNNNRFANNRGWNLTNNNQSNNNNGGWNRNNGNRFNNNGGWNSNSNRSWNNNRSDFTQNNGSTNGNNNNNSSGNNANRNGQNRNAPQNLRRFNNNNHNNSNNNQNSGSFAIQETPINHTLTESFPNFQSEN